MLDRVIHEEIRQLRFSDCPPVARNHSPQPGNFDYHALLRYVDRQRIDRTVSKKILLRKLSTKVPCTSRFSICDNMHQVVLGLLILIFYAAFHVICAGNDWGVKKTMQSFICAKRDVHLCLVHHLRTTYAQRRRLFTIYCEQERQSTLFDSGLYHRSSSSPAHALICLVSFPQL